MARKKADSSKGKTVQSVKNSLKFKASPKSGILSVRVGVKKFSLPLEARMLSNGDYMFLSFPANSELYRVANKQLAPMSAAEDASAAYEALNPARRRGARRRTRQVDLPEQLANALKSLPPGYKLGYDADGSPKLVRTRKRSKKT